MKKVSILMSAFALVAMVACNNNEAAVEETPMVEETMVEETPVVEETTEVADSSAADAAAADATTDAVEATEEAAH